MATKLPPRPKTANRILDWLFSRDTTMTTNKRIVFYTLVLAVIFCACWLCFLVYKIATWGGG